MSEAKSNGAPDYKCLCILLLCKKCKTRQFIRFQNTIAYQEYRLERILKKDLNQIWKFQNSRSPSSIILFQKFWKELSKSINSDNNSFIICNKWWVNSLHRWNQMKLPIKLAKVKNYKLCLKLHNLCKITHGVSNYTLCVKFTYCV